MVGQGVLVADPQAGFVHLQPPHAPAAPPQKLASDTAPIPVIFAEPSKVNAGDIVAALSLITLRRLSRPAPRRPSDGCRAGCRTRLAIAGLGGALGQFAHFISHHGKATPGLGPVNGVRRWSVGMIIQSRQCLPVLPFTPECLCGSQPPAISSKCRRAAATRNRLLGHFADATHASLTKLA